MVHGNTIAPYKRGFMQYELILTHPKLAGCAAVIEKV